MPSSHYPSFGCRKSLPDHLPSLPVETITNMFVFGNGKVCKGFLFGVHHILLVIQTEANHYILLELEICAKNRISIHAAQSGSCQGALDRRLNRKNHVKLRQVHNLSDNRPSTAVVQHIINQYHGRYYNILSRNCRHFVNEVIRSVKSKLF